LKKGQQKCLEIIRDGPLFFSREEGVRQFPEKQTLLEKKSAITFYFDF